MASAFDADGNEQAVTADIGQRRCFHHIGREAAGRCTVCRRDFCAECVTAHDDRLVCARCLDTLAVGRPVGTGGGKWVAAFAGTAALLLVGWCLFFLLLRAIAAMPVAVQDAAPTPRPAAMSEDS